MLDNNNSVAWKAITRLLWLCIIAPSDWLKNPALHSQPIGGRGTINLFLVLNNFPRLSPTERT